MFEKEAEEYKLSHSHYEVAKRENGAEYAKSVENVTIQEAFQHGAEFGYNKANEWHYVKDGDLPNKELEEEQLLVRVRNYTEDYIFAYYMKDKYCSKNGKRFYSDTDCDYPIDIEDIIAWKEIVLPELPKESE